MSSLVSVIIPCYNASAYIGEAIESVLCQTYQDWELLIIDDCSTDESMTIIQQYSEKDSRIHYIKTEGTSGSPALPRNIGIQKARGEYIAFLDSDDVWLPMKLEEQINVFEKNSEISIVFSNYEKMNENGVRNKRFVFAPEYTSYSRLLYGNVIGCSTAMYDVKKVGKVYFPNINHEDYVYWLSILKKGNIARNTNSVNTLYRVRKRSVSSNKWRVMQWQWNIYVNIEKIGYWEAAYFFCNYALKAFVKSLK